MARAPLRWPHQHRQQMPRSVPVILCCAAIYRYHALLNEAASRRPRLARLNTQTRPPYHALAAVAVALVTHLFTVSFASPAALASLSDEAFY